MWHKTNSVLLLFLAVVSLVSATQAFGQSYPSACKPVGTDSCVSKAPGEFVFRARLCSNGFAFDSEPEAAAHYQNQSPPSDTTGCPTPLDTPVGWTNGHVRHIDFSAACANSAQWVFPLSFAGYNNYDYSLYERQRYTNPGCVLSTSLKGMVERQRNIACPENYAAGSQATFCQLSAGKVDPGKNLGRDCETEEQCFVGNPINASVGNKYQLETDFVGSGSNPLRFERHFNSFAGRSMSHNGLYRFSTDGNRSVRASLDPSNEPSLRAVAIDVIGVNWRHTYNRAIKFSGLSGLSSASVYRQTGKVFVFNKYNGSWVSDADVNYSLTELTDGGGNTTGWEIGTPSDQLETYTADGKLLEIEDKNGVAVTLSYDAMGRLSTATDHYGRSLTFGYAAVPQSGAEWWEDSAVENRITSVADAAGKTYSYEYDTEGRLWKVTNPDMSVREYLYENSSYEFALTGIIDENGDRYASWEYDSDGRAHVSYHGVAADITERVDIAYSKGFYEPYHTLNGATITKAQGTPDEVIEQASFSRYLGISKVNSAFVGPNGRSQTYDSAGNIERRTDFNGNVTYRQYNSRNLVSSLTEAETTPLERVTTFAWHTNYRLPELVTRPSVYGTGNYVTDYVYVSGLPRLQRIDESGFEPDGTAIARSTSFTYTADGQIETVDGPRIDVTDVTTFRYYDCATGDECGQLEEIENALGQITTFDAYDAVGRLLQSTDPNGLVTSYGYDDRGRVTLVTFMPTAGLARVTSITYDDVGQLETVSTPDGQVLTYGYDTAHKLRSVTDNFGNSIEYAYDARGNLKDEDTLDPSSALTRQVDYTYDIRDRLDTINNGGFVTDLTFDLLGNLTDETDPKLANTQHSYDALNRLDETLDALTGVTDYDYDIANNLVSVTAANGANTTYEFDDFGNLLSEVSPDRGSITYVYDPAGNLKLRTDARGKDTAYDYDGLNRLDLVTFDGGGTIDYEYDVGANAVGRLVSIVDASGNTAWSYDNFGAITQKTQTIGTVALVTGYGYGDEGRLETVTLPSGKVVGYDYNTFQATDVTIDGLDVLTAATYDPFGPVTGWTWGDSTSSSRNFTQRGLVDTFTLAGDTRTLGHDAAGQIISAIDSTLDASYDYDLLGRLDFVDSEYTGSSGGTSDPGPMFDAAPVILASIQTDTNETGSPPVGTPTPWITAAVRNVSSSGVNLALGRAEVNAGSIGSAETMGFIAIEGGSAGTISANGGSVSYEAQTTTDSVKGWGNGCYTTSFLSGFGSSPIVVGTINRHDGGDGGWARRCSLSSSAVGLTIDEDAFRDSERNHTAEAVGFAAFSANFDVQITDVVGAWGMEAASVALPATTTGSSYHQVTFRQSYVTPPVVVVLATNQGSDPAAIRVRNVTTTGFEAAQVEPANNDGPHAAMTMHYLAVEPGTHELPDGTRILADTISTSSQQHGSGVSGSESWHAVTFAGWPGGTLPGSSVAYIHDLDYDSNGNRDNIDIDGTDFDYVIAPNSNRLVSVAGPAAMSYLYDASGNITSDGAHNYDYDDRGRLVDVDSGAATYTYNGQGQRVSKDTGAVTLFAYDESGNLLGEYDDQGTAIREHVWFAGAPVALLEGADVYYVHTDQLGTPRVISDGATVIWRWQSDPFGTTSAEEDPDGDGTPLTYNLRFPGQYLDVETGHHYNYYRTYDPSTGRYLESDPIGLDGGLNTYGYVGGNPLSFVDPLGLYCSPGYRMTPIPGMEDRYPTIFSCTPGNSNDRWCLNGDCAAYSPDSNSAEDSCDDGCEDPIVMIFYYGDPKSKNRPFRRAEYSRSCVLSMGLLQVGEATAESAVLSAAGEAAEKAGKKGLATAAKVAGGPIGTMLTAPISVMGVFRGCECPSTKQ